MTTGDTAAGDLTADGPVRPGRDVRNAVGVALAVVAAVLLTGPVVNAPFNDDMSYAMTVKRLVETGHLTYNGWASASLIAQAYYGAIWVKLFGFSFTVLRLCVIPLAAAAVAMCYLLARRAGLAPKGAVFAALLLGWSPVFLPIASTFMTDAPGMFCMFLALYALARAGESPNLRAALAWLAVGTVVAGVGGTGRQIVWVVPLAVAPYLAWVRRREMAFVAAAAVAWVAVFATAVLTVRWFNHQMYTIPEAAPMSDLKRGLHSPVHFTANVLGLGLTLVWLAVPAAGVVVRRVRGRWAVLSAVLLAMVAVALFARHHSVARDAARHHVAEHRDPAFLYPSALPPWMPNTLEYNGVMGPFEVGGDRPIVFPLAARVAISVVVFGLTCLMVGGAAKWVTTHGGPRAAVGRGVRAVLYPDRRRILLPAAGLFALAYLVLLLPRSARDMNRTYDRYLLPLLPCLAVPLLLAGQRDRPGRAVGPVAWGLLGLYAGFGIALNQDVSALLRARTAATDRLEAAGIPRAQIQGGFEYNFWTQMLLSGYINDHRLHPRSAFRAGYVQTPDLRPRYVVNASHTPDAEPTRFGSVRYTSFLPPFRRELFIDQYTDPAHWDPARAGRDDKATAADGVGD